MTHVVVLIVYNLKNLKTLALIDAELMEKFNGKKEKRTNNETHKPFVAGSLIHSTSGWFFITQYNLSYLVFVSNFKILDQVVPEKSLTKISIFITLE